MAMMAVVAMMAMGNLRKILLGEKPNGGP